MDITTLFSNVWSAILVVLFFGGSIFVHELGHFLAARRRGVKVERFSIGFGPKIFSWVGKDGVEYRLSWLPLGGYVALPQLADMSTIEGPASVDTAKLPPPTYSTKVIVFAAGAFFNILFAFVLGTVLWILGQQVAKEEQTNQVGVVLERIELPNGQLMPGPAYAAGVKPGDIIRTVDGKSVRSLSDIGYLVALGSGRGENYEPKVDLVVERDGRTLPITVYPQKIGSEKVREIGIEPSTKVFIGGVQKGSAAEAAGLQADDLITHIDGKTVRYQSMIREHLHETSGRPVQIGYERAGKAYVLTATPLKVVDPQTNSHAYRLGVLLRGEFTIETVHIAPWTQIQRHAVTTWRTFVSLVSPRSDIGLSKMSGPIGIAERLHAFAQYDFRAVLWFAILINVNLAIFNLLPIPVLDGGHIFFATIAKLRGRPLPAQFIAATQSMFILILFSLMIYVSFFDVRRIASFRAAEKPAPAQPAPAKP